MRAFVISNMITKREEKSLDKYLVEVSRYDVLTADEELELFHTYQAGDESVFDKIILHNLRFVVSVAKRYQNLGLSLNSLINEGNIGLIKAARRFDITRGFKFISYAVWWIRQSILQAINESGRNIRLPLNMTAQISRIHNAREDFYQQEEREPTAEELAEFTGMSIKKVTIGLKNYKRCTSLDTPVEEGSNTALAQLMQDDSIRPPDFEMSVRQTQRTDVEKLLKLISPTEATVLSMYFGIQRAEPCTLSTIAEHIGLGRERVRQIRDRGLKKLRMRTSEFTPTFAPA